MGLTFIKFDIGMHLLEGIKNSRIGTPTKHEKINPAIGVTTPGTGTGVHVTDKGIARMAEVVAAVREAVGWDVVVHRPLRPRHDDDEEVIKLGYALEPYGLAWMEDPVQWWDVEGHKEVRDSVCPLRRRRGTVSARRLPAVPGEPCHRYRPSRPAHQRRHAGDQAHRRPRRALRHPHGLALRRLADRIHGQHPHGRRDPSFHVALEHHGLDLPFWEGLVTGLPQNYMEGGYVTVPDKPGLGVDLNLEGIEANLRPPSGLFEETSYWDTPKLGFWQPDKRWDRVKQKV